MKVYILIAILIVPLLTNGQNKMIFEYDQSGNQIKRQLCINCPIPDRKAENDIYSDEDNLLKFFDEDVISYYPNPVKEVLFIKWKITYDSKVYTIKIYTLNGQLLKTHNNLELTDNSSLSFNEYPIGMYSVVLFYTNGVSKAIKIIKI